jgi:N6-adenosine-specific RNA methylase IME4
MIVPASVLVADPPWSFDDDLPGDGRGASKHYDVLTLDDILRFRLPPLRDDCVLLLWRVASMQEEALQVVRAWGFEKPKSEIVWNKETKTGKRHFGMGRYVRDEHETCLIARRGKWQPSGPLARSTRSTFRAPVGEHSAKPDAFYDLVESWAAGPFAELFARRRRSGWMQYGMELPARAVGANGP